MLLLIAAWIEASGLPSQLSSLARDAATPGLLARRRKQHVKLIVAAIMRLAHIAEQIGLPATDTVFDGVDGPSKVLA